MLPTMKIATRRFSPTNNNNNGLANGGYPGCPPFFYQQGFNSGRNGFNYNAKGDVDGCLKQQQIQFQQTQLHNVTSSNSIASSSSNSGSFSSSSSSVAGGGLNGSIPSPDFENNQQLFLQSSQHQQSRMTSIFPTVAAASSCSCCLPTGCLKGIDDSVFLERKDDGGSVQAKNGVRLRCNNLVCQELKWMHLECFQEWKVKLQCLVASPRRTRHLSDKDAFPHHHHGLPWGKRDLDPEARLCACRCGKGSLMIESSRPTLESLPDSKSLTNGVGCLPSPSPSASHWDRKFSFSQRDGLAGFSGGSSAPFCQQVLNSPSCRLSSPPFSASGLGSGNFFSNDTFMQQLLQGLQQQQQQQQSSAAVSQYLQLHSLQQNSLPSSGSGLTIGGGARKQRGSTSSALSSRMFDFFADRSKAAAGNIFRRRTDMSSFDSLPVPTRNSYNVRIEDEGPYGNDETRCFLLTALSSVSRTTVKCVVCKCDLSVYDKYPLINGTFFLSPESYDGCGLDVTHHNRRLHHHHHHQASAQQQQQQFLNAVCIECAHGTRCRVGCLACGSLWRGNALVIGTMYNYDVFAAMSCCSSRLSCTRCGLAVREVPAKQPAISAGNPVASSSVNAPSFSDFCRSIACPRCGMEACHAVKPLPAIFKINVVQNQ